MQLHQHSWKLGKLAEITHFDGILHHSARARKQKTLKILCFVICVEDYNKLTKTQFLIQFSLGNLVPHPTTSLATDIVNVTDTNVVTAPFNASILKLFDKALYT